MSELRPFDREDAHALNKARMEHLLSLGLPLAGARVLEVGAGVGHLTTWLENAGAAVISTEVRAGNCEENLYRHPHRAGSVYCADVMDLKFHRSLGPFDLILCYGLLYHLPDPAAALQVLGQLGAPIIAIESIVLPGKGLLRQPHEDVLDTDQSIDGRACRFTSAYLIDIIVEAGWPCVTLPAPPDHFEFQGDEPRRRVVIGSKEPL